jgi:hypothetical protein
MTLILFYVALKLGIASLCSFLKLPAAASHMSWVFFTTPCSQTRANCVLHLGREDSFYTHIKQGIKMVKVKVSLCFNWVPRHEGVSGEWGYSSTTSMTSTLDGGESSVSSTGRFTPRGRAPGFHCIRGWVDVSHLNGEEKPTLTSKTTPTP